MAQNDYHFIINELVNTFECEFKCLGESSEKYKGMRFIATSLSNLVDNLADGICKTKCKCCDCFIEYERVKGSLIKYDCLSYNKDHSWKLDEGLKERFKNAFTFSKNDINKFVSLLRKGIYPYEYIDDWDKFIEKKFKNKEFYSSLNMKGIMDEDYAHAKRLSKDFKIKNSGDYHGLYLKSDALLLADVFENFRDMCLEIYELDLTKFISVSWLAWHGRLKKTQVKLDLLNDVYMSLMVERGTRERMYNAIHHNAKANNKYVNDYNENNESSYINYWDVNNLYCWAMMQKLPTF